MLFRLAEYPMRLRTTPNPVSKRMMPAKDKPKLFSYLLPDEVLLLVSAPSIPMGRRVAYALAVYTGLRKGSLLSLRWEHVDLANGLLTVLHTKTGHPQCFEIRADLVGVLRRWRASRSAVASDAVIADCEIDAGREAQVMRDDLRAVGVTREVLFSDDPKVEPIRFHDCRSTFVTWAKRDERGDGWISDRTGHLTGEMIDRYTRAARTLADLRIKPFPDLLPAFADLPDPPADGRRMDAASGATKTESPESLARSAVTQGFLVDLVGIEPTTSRVRF